MVGIEMNYDKRKKRENKRMAYEWILGERGEKRDREEEEEDTEQERKRDRERLRI